MEKLFLRGMPVVCLWNRRRRNNHAQQNYDAIIVGSGITGGWAAKEFGEKGLQTLVLEAGRPIDPEKDYAEHVPDLGNEIPRHGRPQGHR